MGALLVALAIMGVMMSVALPVWNQMAKREREAELVFRGEQYARAIELFQRTYAASYPEDIDELIDERFLRERYRDPMTENGEFRVVYEAEVAQMLEGAPTAPLPGQAVRGPRPESSDDNDRETATGADQRQRPRLQLDDEPPAAGTRGGVVGVVSRSKEESLMIYDGATKYSEWAFIYTPSAADPGVAAPGADPSNRGATELGFGQGSTPVAPR